MSEQARTLTLDAIVWDPGIYALLRVADPTGERYDGWYVLWTEHDDIETLSEFKINGARLTPAEFIDWVSFGDTTVEPRRPAPRFAWFMAKLTSRLAQKLAGFEEAS